MPIQAIITPFADEQELLNTERNPDKYKALRRAFREYKKTHPGVERIGTGIYRARINLGIPSEPVIIKLEGSRVRINYETIPTKENADIAQKRVRQHATELTDFLASFTNHQAGLQYQKVIFFSR